MAVTTVFASTNSADLLSQNASYTTAANGSGVTTPVNSANELWVGQLLLGSYSCYLSFIDFDLSGLASAQSVSSAVLSMYMVTKSTAAGDHYQIVLLYDWGASVTSADWQDPAEQVALGAWWTYVHTSGLGAAGSYKAFADTPDMRNLCELFSGIRLPLVVASELHRGALAPTGAQFITWASADVVGTTQDPKLTITHSRLLVDAAGAGGGVGGGAATITTKPLRNVYGRGGGVAGGSAPMTFVHGGGAVASDLVVEWDLDGDGDFADPYEDITSRVLAIETTSGRTAPNDLAPAGPGTLKLTCLNDDDAFSFFNTGSPLNTAPNTLKSGRRIRVRTSESTATDPVLLVRDRFDRADAAGLGTAETGQVWNARASGFSVVNETAQADDTPGVATVHTIESGETGHYVQATVRQISTGRHIGLIGRYTDLNNYVYCYISATASTGIVLAQKVAGVATQIGDSPEPMQGWEGMTIGLEVVGTTCTAYVNGVQVATGTTTAPAGTEVGLYTQHSSFTGRLPEIDDFHCWDRMASEQDGVIWTGYVDKVDIAVRPGPEKVATVTGTGILEALARTKIAAPRLPKAGTETGMLVGDVLSRAGALHPPQPLDRGALTTGPIGINDGQALNLARQFETVERGFIYETNEGQVGFTDSDGRTGAAVQALFSDAPGAQFGYTALTPLDQREAIVNQVIAGVAAEAPTEVSTTNRAGVGGAGNHVDVVLPTTAAGDLLVVFIASTINDGGDWDVPIWWASHRDVKAANGMRVYSHFCDGTESGDTVRFYTNDGGAAGLWTANIVRIDNWFESYAGVAMSDPAPGDDPNAVFHGWGRYPTMFIVARAGIGATGATSWTTNIDPPDGYGSTTGNRVSSGVASTDVAIASAIKVDVTEVENPTAFEVLTGYDLIDETVVFAVRGYNGPHTKATLDNPRTTGGDGRTVTVDDLDSQDEHNALMTHEAPALFADETDATAYGLLTVAKHADDRPVLAIEFPAVKSGHYRNQAIARRVGHKIRCDTRNNAGFHAYGEYFIEHITHQMSNGVTDWQVRWEVSPAT